MSIYAYVGLPGSGKSYDVVANQILPALRASRTVVTNVSLKLDALRVVVPDADIREFPTELIAADPPRLDEFVMPGCVLVLDEVWRLFPAGQKVNHVPEPFKKLLAEHRHMVDERGNSTQIVLVTQDLAQIGAFARQLVEQTFYHTKLSAVGARGTYRIDIYHGARTGPAPPKEARINEQFGRYSKDIFALYNSHTMSRKEGTEGGANELTMDKRGNIWRRPGLIIGAVVCIALAAWAIPTVGSVFGGDEPEAARASAASVATGAARPSSGSGFAPARAAGGTPVGRIAGIVEAAGDSYAILQAEGRAWRIPLLRYCDRTQFSWECRVGGVVYAYEAAPWAASAPSPLAKPVQ